MSKYRRSKVKPRIFQRPDRWIQWIGEVNTHIAYSVQERLTRELVRNKTHRLRKPEYALFLNSGGGELDVAIGFYDWINNVNLRLTPIAQGFIGSSAVVLLLCGEKRYSFPATTFFLHPVTINYQGELNALEGRYYAKYLERATEQYVEIICSKTGMNPKQVNRYMENHHYINSKEALELGLITDIIPDKQSEVVENNFRRKFKLVR
jgi:ATP-dependent protease ClpP protease subunit